MAERPLPPGGRMRLKLLTPTHVVVDDEATRILAEAKNGWFCLLPRHVDFVAALTSGVLIYTSPPGFEHLLAVDEGTLVKCGGEVLVSVRNAVRGTSLDRLKDVVEQEFRTRSEQEREAHSALARLEAGALRRLGQLER
jgi:F-type H+-transporting ATPase subunit epsilon